MLLDDVTSETQRVIATHQEQVSLWIAARKRFEVWLQTALFNALKSGNPSLIREVPYPNSKDTCDFWCREQDGQDSWVELKLCATNYCRSFTGPGSPRPITQQVTHMLLDVEKLARLSESVNRGMLLIAFPMPNNHQLHSAWRAHLARFESHACTIDEAFVVPVKRGSAIASIVGYRVTL